MDVRDHSDFTIVAAVPYDIITVTCITVDANSGTLAVFSAVLTIYIGKCALNMQGYHARIFFRGKAEINCDLKRRC